MKKLRRLFQASIARTMLGGFLLVIIPTLLLGIFSNIAGINAANSEISSSYNNAITLLGRQMADRLYNMDLLAASTLLDDDLVALSNVGEDAVDLYEYKLFQKRMLLYQTPQFINANMVVCLPRQGWLISTEEGVMRMEGRVDLAAVGSGDTVWSIRESRLAPPQQCLSVFRGYAHENQSSPFLFTEISNKEVEQVLGTMSSNTQVLRTFFLDPFGNHISTGNELDAGLLEEMQELFARGLENSENQMTIRHGGREYRLLYQDVGSYNCKIGMLLDESELMRPVLTIRAIFVVFMIFAVLASLVFIFLTYRKIFTPVRALTGAMLELEKGNLNVRAEVEEGNEFSVMSRQFNNTVERLDSLIMESYVKELKLKNAQLRFLRSQINPHFLYNSLFSLYNMIQNEELESASSMAVYLGKYYQRSAHLRERELTIAEEIENIRMYIHIMSIRFPDRLQLVTSVEQRAEQLRIPVLSLQTIVENAVLHGMEGSSRRCLVAVEANIEGQVLSLVVSDTGNGISPEQLAQIRERLSHSVDIEDSHGLENVYMRLRLMYGESVTMELSENSPTGTRVEIRIPLKEGDCTV